MSVVKEIHAYEIIDSRGIPTIEAVLTMDDGKTVVSSVPSSFDDRNDYIDLRDKDPLRFNGMGVSKAISYINDLISPKLKGASVLKQLELDKWLTKADPSNDRSKLGINTFLIISTLFAKAGALLSNIDLFTYINKLYVDITGDKINLEKVPSPVFNMINGGKYNIAPIDFQEFFLIPSSSYSFSFSYQKGVELFHELRKVLGYRNATVAVGEEGGYSPNLSSNMDVLEILTETVNQKNMRLGIEVFFGIDMASTYFFRNNQYVIHDKQHPLKKDEYLEFIFHLTENYSILYIEDPFIESDNDNWKKLNTNVGSQMYIVSDEFSRGNIKKVTQSIENNCCNSFVIKVNQIGTVSEIVELVHLARKNNTNYIVATSSSETNDTFVADLAVAVQSLFIKFGAPVRGERVAKYNRLWQIEEKYFKK